MDELYIFIGLYWAGLICSGFWYFLKAPLYTIRRIWSRFYCYRIDLDITWYMILKHICIYRFLVIFGGKNDILNELTVCYASLAIGMALL